MRQFVKDDKGDDLFVRMDIKSACYPGPEYVSCKLHQTGSSDFNTLCSTSALKYGFKLSQLGLAIIKKETAFKRLSAISFSPQVIKTCSDVEVLNVEEEEIFKILGINASFYSELTNRNNKPKH